ncbi:hypothetical protein C8Q76DRAFT_629932 [Earliella scabrosa]|nr:hypothetical protein C8Q76DRAFT_629932 [Earliella scabrosa]
MRSGKCHGVSYPNRPPELIATPCYACPWPGVNLPADYKDTPERLRYIYRLCLGADGNHSLQKKTKRDDQSDFSLARGRAFFTNRRLIDYIKRYPKDTAKVETCSGFKVTRSQRAGKFRNLDISGVVAISCIRHGCFMPRAVVDLPGGEQFPLVDLAMCGPLELARELVEIMFTYDVGCEYVCRLLDRWKEWNLPPEFLPIVETVKVLLPQLHMLAHKESCQTNYAICYKRGCGHSNGETVESNWFPHNAVGLSTREMNGGARQDSINDHFNFWNWVKNEIRGMQRARPFSMQAAEACTIVVSSLHCSKVAGKTSFAAGPDARPCGPHNRGRT